MSHRVIRIRGLKVHNLKDISLEISHGKLIGITGVSGSGKSSLAFDTLFAEGQRRYIETFSSYTRQFLERIDRPEAESIENLPPAIAIRQRTSARNSRSTVGSITEINDYLRLMYAKIGQVFCPSCDRQIRSDSPSTVGDAMSQLEPGDEYLVSFPIVKPARVKLADICEVLKADGFVRVFVRDSIHSLHDDKVPSPTKAKPLRVIVDRLRAERSSRERVLDSVETAFTKGQGVCDILLPANNSKAEWLQTRAAQTEPLGEYVLLRFSRHWRCDYCEIDIPEPEPRLFNFNHPSGACPECRGFGDIVDVDMELVVPDPSKSIREGAIVPWNTPNYEHELRELLDLADDYDVPVDIPFSELDESHRMLIWDGVKERRFGGLSGFFRWLERKKYKMHIRVFLSRYRGYKQCPVCNGARLKAESLACRIGGLNISEFLALSAEAGLEFLQKLELDDTARAMSRVMLDQISRRLEYLTSVGLGYLTLGRPIRTLSGGEAQRVGLTKALGAGLVNTLYVLDEPSIGLHERDSRRLIDILQRLRDAQNTVIVVEHDESIIRSCDELIDIGPGAGRHGGQIVYQGAVESRNGKTNSLTLEFLSGRRQIQANRKPRTPKRKLIRLVGATGNNLKNLSVDFPLGLLCVVTGVSGSGKSTLVEDTLFAAINRELGKPGPKPAPYRRISGLAGIEECVMVDQSPIGRSSRSNPATYVKAFDEIRTAFSKTSEAKIRNYSPGAFSFNVEGGRCQACEGQGEQTVDMQFLADIHVTCPDCNGSRYRRDILDIKYRGKNIAEVLAMPIADAYEFFRGKEKLQSKLKPLLDVGLGYLQLGQPATTLSGGEAQRMKLASQMGARSKKNTLLIMDEPTTGLHRSDIEQLLKCFEALLALGHSLIVVEHNMDVIRSADWVIDLGPDAAEHGGELVGCGHPHEIATIAESQTGQFIVP